MEAWLDFWRFIFENPAVVIGAVIGLIVIGIVIVVIESRIRRKREEYSPWEKVEKGYYRWRK